MTSVPLLPLHQLSLYNTGRMPSEQIIAAFAARRQQFERIIADVTAEKPKSRAQHHLVVGQRGMGKTMLLARIAAELRTDPNLSAHFIPLVFAEEQYAVDRLSKFWLNCLDSLADARELSNDMDSVAGIDATVDRLKATEIRAAKDDQPFANEVYVAFTEAASASGQRPVLLVDNLQLVFDRIDTRQQHELRELLMRPGSPILIGTSPSPPRQSQDYGAPFYDHFKVHYLRPLQESEMRALLVHLADVAKRDDVRQRVLRHPARLKVLRQLTGGNPRTTLTLFFLYAEDFAPSVFGDLEGLLDRVTPLYKARFEELTPQQQVIASAIANHWDPVTATVLVNVTGLPAGTISSQLDRLEKLGFIERTELFGETRTGYQLAERFFNIWFLMRSASRRQRREVEFLTRFLESFYEPAERSRLARHLMREERFSPDRYVWSRAVAASLTDPDTAEELTRHAELTALLEEAREARARLRELIDFDSLPPATLAFDELRRKLMSLVPDDARIMPSEFARLVLGDRSMFVSREREQLAARSGKLTSAEIETIIDTIQKSKAADEQRYSPEAVEWFSHRLSSGQIRAQQDADDWNRAFKQATGKKVITLMATSLPAEFPAISDTAIDVIRACIKLDVKAPATKWFRWGRELSEKFGRHAEAETVFREGLQLHADNLALWIGLGNALLQENRETEAEAAYRKAISLDSKSAWARGALGNLFHQRQCFEEAIAAYQAALELDPRYARLWLGLARVFEEVERFEEAESAYHRAIAIGPDANAWIALGNLLRDHTTRFNEAEVAYRQAIELAPTSSRAWDELGDLFYHHLQRIAEAEAAYRKAVALDPENSWAWERLGDVLSDHFQRLEEAEAAYRRVLRIRPESRYTWLNLGVALAMQVRLDEAETAFREVIKLDPSSYQAWDQLADLLRDRGRFSEAETAYRKCIELAPDYDSAWIGLGNLYCDDLIRFTDAAEAYDRAQRLDPTNESTPHNQLFLHRDFMGEVAESRSLLERVRKLSNKDIFDTMHLQEALFAAYDSNWGVTRDSLVKALEIRANGFDPSTTDDWLRATAVLLHLNYGAELLAFLDERGDTARLRPWVEAIRAFQAGDRRALQNIAPEIRTTAEIFYDGIEKRLNKLPEKTRRRPIAQKKSQRRKRG